MRSVVGKALIWGLVVAATSFAGCSNDAKPSSGSSTGATGDIGLELQIGGTTINSVHYRINNNPANTPGGSSCNASAQGCYEGDLDVADASHLLAVVGGIEAGAGYILNLSATGTNGTPCSGQSSSFTVVANSTVIVGIQLLCRPGNDAGSVKIEGTAVECAHFGSISAAVPNGATIQITTTTVPANPNPPVTFWWSGPGAGGLSSTSSPNPLYFCHNTDTSDQKVELDLHMSQGSTMICNAQFHLIIDCPPGSNGASGAGGTGGTGGAGGTGGTGGVNYTSGCVDGDCTQCIVDDNGGPADPCPTLTGNAVAGPAAGAPLSQLCRETLDCFHQTGCHANAVFECYCGTAIDQGSCSTATTIPMPGACKTQLDRSLEIPAGSAGGVALGRLTDSTYAGGWAGITATYENSACPTTCLPYDCGATGTDGGGAVGGGAVGGGGVGGGGLGAYVTE